jgi:hypothetical protein
MTDKNPLFAMLPADVLTKAKNIAEECYAEERLKDLVGRRIFTLCGTILLLLFLSGANAFVFVPLAVNLFGGSGNWIGKCIGIYALIICLGGTTMMFSAVIAWLEIVAMRGANPTFNAHGENMRFYKRATWLPLIPLSVLPALFNAWFSVTFLFATISLLFVFVVLFSLFSDV